MKRMERTALCVALLLLFFSHFTTVRSGATKDDIQNYIEGVVAKFKVSLRRRAIQEHGTRKKRSVQSQDFQDDQHNTSTGDYSPKSFYLIKNKY